MMNMGQKPNVPEAPELRIGLQLYFQAFLDLDGERMQALFPIPWTSIKSYATAFELDEEQTEDLFFFDKKMDEAHLSRMAKKASSHNA